LHGFTVRPGTDARLSGFGLDYSEGILSKIQNYFNGVADKVAAQSSLAGIAQHRPDIGLNREIIVRDFLLKHLPKRLHASLGGKIISSDGSESNQIDIIIHNDIGIRFEENERTFITAESVASVITIKSSLDRAGLIDSLLNLSTVPDPSPSTLDFKTLRSTAFDKFVEFHPSRHVFAFDGVNAQTCLRHIEEFYSLHPEIPNNRYPKNIIVNRKYIISYSKNSRTAANGSIVPENPFYLVELQDLNRGYPFVSLLNDVTSYLDWLNHMSTDHIAYFNDAYRPK
jgi:hypothetical protein